MFFKEPVRFQIPEQIAFVRQPEQERVAYLDEDIEQALEAAMKEGGIQSNISRINLVGQGRAGKTAFANALAGVPFKQTDSTVGVSLNMMEVAKMDMLSEAGGAWKGVSSSESAPSAEAARTRVAAQKLAAKAKNEPLAQTRCEDNMVNYLCRSEPTQGGSAELAEPAAWAAEQPANHSRVENQPKILAPTDGGGTIRIDQGADIVTNANALAMPAPIDVYERVLAEDMPVSKQIPTQPDTFPETGTVHRGKDEPAAPKQSVREEAMSKIDKELVLSIAQGGAEQSLRLSLWDFAGQDVFYSLHHLYLTRYGVYLVMFNMEWLSSTAGDDVRAECLGFLRFWLNSISVHAVDPADQSIAPIFLIGTHKDLVREPREHGAISRLLYDTFHSNPAWRNVVFFKEGETETGRSILCFFPVNNKLGVGDAVICRVQQMIQECVSKEEYVRKLVPFEWMHAMDGLRAQGHMSVSLGEVMRLAQTCGMPTTELPLEREVLLMLKFYNEMGVVMHHEEPALRELVVLDPANFLIVPATKVICSHAGGMHEQAEHAEARRQMFRAYDRLCKQGVLDRKLLGVLWRDHLGHERELERLMVKYGLMIPVVEREADASVDKYLVPSLLPAADAAAAAFGPGSRPRLRGYLVFARPEEMAEWRANGFVSTQDVAEDGFLPNGLFAQVHRMSHTTRTR
jgi:NLR family CARD domain-containing protein 3